MQRTLANLVFVFLGTPTIAGSCGPYDGDVNDYVALHSHTYPAAEMVMARIEAIDDPFEAVVPLKAYGDFAQMGIVDVVLPMIALSCNYELFSANGCAGTFFLPNNVENASLADDSLRFVTHDPETGLTIDIVHKNRSYDRSIVTMPGVVSTWNRAADGTETFLSVAENGDETGYAENPDCSGEGHVIRHNEVGLLTTNHFSWSSATSQNMTFQYKLCRHQEPDDGCHEGRI